MLLLSEAPCSTCAEISHLLKVSNSAVSNAVRSLSRVKHYVEREKVAGSGKIKVQLTEEGVSTAQEIRERFITRYMKQFDVTHGGMRRRIIRATGRAICRRSSGKASRASKTSLAP